MTGNTPTTLNTISPELLSEIFWHCVYDEPDEYVPRSAPLLLGRVCSRWRSISISTPELWSTIVIGGHTSNVADKFRQDLEATTVWIKRSGTRPLSFHIHVYARTLEDYGSAFRQVLDTVVSQSPRWRSVHASLPVQHMELLLAPLTEGKTPKLEDFNTYCNSPPAVTLHFYPRTIALSSSPHLKRLQVFGAPIHIDFGDQIHNVQSISVGPREYVKFSLGDLLQCLTQCPSLISLRLQIGESSPAATLQHSLPNVIALTNLHTLTLNLNATIDPYLVFDRLFLPSIKYLRLEMSQCSQTDWPYLASVLKRSQPPLATLYLTGVPLIEGTLIECLSCIPKLSIVSLRGISCSDITLAALTIDDKEGSNSAILCPYLSGITFGPPTLFSPNALKAMMLSRWRGSDQVSNITPGRALRAVHCSSELVGALHLDPDILPCLIGGLKLASPEEEY